jgi:hypothetical protein
MNTVSIKLATLFICSIVIVYLVKQIFFNKSAPNKQDKSDKPEEQYIGKEGYLLKDDPNAQVIYEKNKLNFFSLNNIKNKLELSWEFLYEITEIVLKKFNSQDKNLVHEIGKKLHNAGMQYNHVIDYSINIEKINQQNINKSSQKINR